MSENDAPWERMFEAATAVRERAHAPYSRFKVGAAALWEDGEITAGCNVENSSYGLSVCAERNAIGAAVASGKRKLQAVAIVAEADRACPPCGMCRQVMAEFGDPKVPVRARNFGGDESRHTLGELLPDAFGADFL